MDLTRILLAKLYVVISHPLHDHCRRNWGGVDAGCNVVVVNIYHSWTALVGIIKARAVIIIVDAHVIDVTLFVGPPVIPAAEVSVDRKSVV